MIRRWGQLQSREQAALILGAVAGAALLFYGFVWSPFGAERARLAERVEQQRALLQWMQGAARQVQTLRRGAPVATGPAGESLAARVERTARTAGLTESLRRIQPEGPGGVHLRLEDVPFDPLMRWIGQLVASGAISVHEFAAERVEGAGRADVRIVLREGAPR